MNKEEINHRAYMDVLEDLAPSMSDEYYLECYRFWRSIRGYDRCDVCD